MSVAPLLCILPPASTGSSSVSSNDDGGGSNANVSSSTAEISEHAVNEKCAALQQR